MRSTKKAIALGTFDGIHKGHRAVLEYAKDCYLTVLTFSFPPKSYLTGENSLLMLPKDKEKGLKKLGADKTVFLDFNEIKDITAEVFLNDIKDKYSPDIIICGFDFRFGKNALGTPLLLESFCKDNDIKFISVPPVTENGIPISSTNLRNLIQNGNVFEANKQIFGGFGFSAEVLDGDKRGRTIGFPTVNQKFPDILAKPKYGVYKSEMIIDGKKYTSVTNLGIRPTFPTDDVYCETHILDFEGDLYGKTLRLTLLQFLREEMKFSDISQLKSAIEKDIFLIKGENL